MSTLEPGKSLKRGQELRSMNRRYVAAMQHDGNFVVYDYDRCRPLWASNTVGRGDFVIMQTDGNLVVYSGDHPTWASDTWNRGHHLIMQDDGSLAVCHSGGNPVWVANKMK